MEPNEAQVWPRWGPVRLACAKFAARVSLFYTIVPCSLPEMPSESMERKAMKLTIDPKAIEESEMRARIVALPPGSHYGRFYKRKDGTTAKYKGAHVEATVPKAMRKPMTQRTVTVTQRTVTVKAQISSPRPKFRSPRPKFR